MNIIVRVTVALKDALNRSAVPRKFPPPSRTFTVNVSKFTMPEEGYGPKLEGKVALRRYPFVPKVTCTI